MTIMHMSLWDLKVNRSTTKLKDKENLFTANAQIIMIKNLIYIYFLKLVLCLYLLFAIANS